MQTTVRRLEGPATFRPIIDHPGGCYTCRFFGERRDPAVWCAYPGGEHVRAQAELGCSFWQREAGADFEPLERAVTADVRSPRPRP